MLAHWMKDWKTVCKLASGPHYMHMILCGGAWFLSGRESSVGMSRSRSDAEPHYCFHLVAYLLYHQSTSASWRTHERSIRPHDLSVLVMIHIYDSDSTGTRRAAVTEIWQFEDTHLSKATGRQRPLTHSALIAGLWISHNSECLMCREV